MRKDRNELMIGPSCNDGLSLLMFLGVVCLAHLLPSQAKAGNSLSLLFISLRLQTPFFGGSLGKILHLVRAASPRRQISPASIPTRFVGNIFLPFFALGLSLRHLTKPHYSTTCVILPLPRTQTFCTNPHLPWAGTTGVGRNHLSHPFLCSFFAIPYS